MIMTHKNNIKEQKRNNKSSVCENEEHFDLRKSYSIYITALAISLAGLVAVILYAMNMDDDKKQVYTTSKVAVNEYHDFYTTLKAFDKISMEDISSKVKEWQDINISVLECLDNDTVYVPHTDYEGAYKNIHDSIQQEFYRLIFSKERNYKDVLLLKEAASSYAEDCVMATAARKAKPFFSSLADTPIHKGDIWSILKSYRSFLDECASRGIHSKEDLLGFIKDEDILFRSFIHHLHELGNDSIADITYKTEEICRSISEAVNDSCINQEEALVYMTIRTNRRLIQNAQQCINDIKLKRIDTKEQAQAYIWMMLQPYSSIDGFGIALLSDSDRAALYEVAGETADAIEALNSGLRLNNKRFAELPSLLMKIIIATH